MSPLGDVAHRCAFLSAVGDQRCSIGIDDGAVEKAQALAKFVAKSVVGSL